MGFPRDGTQQLRCVAVEAVHASAIASSITCGNETGVVHFSRAHRHTVGPCDLGGEATEMPHRDNHQDTSGTTDRHGPPSALRSDLWARASRLGIDGMPSTKGSHALAGGKSCGPKGPHPLQPVSRHGTAPRMHQEVSSPRRVRAATLGQFMDAANAFGVFPDPGRL